MKVKRADFISSIQPSGFGAITSVTEKTGDGKLLDIELLTEGNLKKWLKVTRIDPGTRQPLGRSFYVPDSNVEYLELAEEPPAPAKK